MSSINSKYWFEQGLDKQACQEFQLLDELDVQTCTQVQCFSRDFWDSLSHVIRNDPFSALFLIKHLRQRCLEILRNLQRHDELDDVVSCQISDTVKQDIHRYCEDIIENIKSSLLQKLIDILNQIHGSSEDSYAQDDSVSKKDKLKYNLHILLTVVDSNHQMFDMMVSKLLDACVHKQLEISNIQLCLMSSSCGVLKDFMKLEECFPNERQEFFELPNLKNCFMKIIEDQTHFNNMLLDAINNTEIKTDWTRSIEFLSIFQQWVMSTKNSKESLLIDKLLDNYSEIDESLLSLVAQKRSDMLVAEWCSEQFPHLAMNKFLILLENHTPLYAIHHSIPLCQINHQRLLTLLSTGSTFNDDVILRDSTLATYKAFYVIRKTLNIIVAGMNLDRTVSIWREKFMKSMKSDTDARLMTDTERQACLSYYTNAIENHWDDIIEHIAGIQNFSFRLEVIENLYSLLFLHHTDLSDEISMGGVADDSYCSPSGSVCSGSSFTTTASSPVSSLEEKPVTSATLPLKESQSRIPVIEEPNMGVYQSQFYDLVSVLNPQACRVLPLNDIAKQGFIINDLVGWDLLLCVKNCLDQWQIDYEHQSEREVMEAEIANRMKKLSKKVDESLWRISMLRPTEREIRSLEGIGVFMLGEIFPSISLFDNYEAHQAVAPRDSCKRRPQDLLLNKSKNWTLLDYLVAPPLDLARIALIQHDYEKAYQIISLNALETSLESHELQLFQKLDKIIPPKQTLPSCGEVDNDLNLNELASVQHFIKSFHSGLHSDQDIVWNLLLTCSISFENVRKLCSLLVKCPEECKKGTVFRNFVHEIFSLIEQSIEINEFVSASSAAEVTSAASLLVSSYPLDYTNFKAMWNQCKNISKKVMAVSDLWHSYDWHYHKSQELISELTSFQNSFATTSMPDEQNVKAYGITFLKYLDRLCTALRKYKKKSLQTEDPLKVIGIRPINLLGDLLFKHNVQPSAIESIAVELKIDLLKVIVHQVCNPIILHYVAPDLREMREESLLSCGGRYVDGVYILNHGCMSCEKPMNAAIICRDILSSLLENLLDILPLTEVTNEITGHVLSSMSIKSVRSDPNIKQLLLDTADLACCDFSKFESNKELASFFVNLFNLMTIHATLVNPIIFGDGSRGIMSPSNFEQSNAMRCVGYIIGSMGFVSLFQLKNYLQAPSKYPGFRVRKDLCIDEYVPYAQFLVSDGSQASPIIQAYTSDSFSDEIRESIKNYFDTCTSSKLSSAERNLFYSFLQNFPKGWQDGFSLLKRLLPADLHHFLKDLEKGKVATIIETERKFVLSKLHIEYKSKIEDKISESEKNRTTCKNVPKAVQNYIQSNCPLLDIIIECLNGKISQPGKDSLKLVSLRSNGYNIGYWYHFMKEYQHFQSVLQCPWNDMVSLKYFDCHYILKKITTKSEESSKEVLSILLTLPTRVLKFLPELNVLKDSLVSAAVETSVKGVFNGSRIIFELSNVEEKFELGQKYHMNWDLPFVYHWLKTMISETLLDNSSRQWALQRQKQLVCYEMMTEIQNSPWPTWQKVCEVSANEPRAILKHCMLNQHHDVVSCWADCHMTADLLVYIDQSSLQRILMSPDPDLSAASSILAVMDTQKCVATLKLLLDRLSISKARKFAIAEYISRTDEDVFQLRQELMGLILIEDVASISDKYQLHCLYKRPYLILEQWIMNLQLSMVRKGLVLIKEHLDQTECRTTDCLCWYHFNTMIEKYCMMAVERPQRDGSVESVPFTTPNRGQWQKNADVSICTCCNAIEFSLFVRKHHCRKCGKIVCGSCSTKRCALEGDFSVRVCDTCFRYLDNTVDVAGTSNRNSDIGWFLSSDSYHNSCVRKEFAFDNVPCVSLFQAILNLHGDGKRSALCILDFLLSLFTSLVDSFGESNCDANFILTMAETLLCSAKVKFSIETDDHGIDFCDYYCQWVNLLQLLIKNNCVHLIPKGCLQNMLHIESVQREYLMEPDREKYVEIEKGRQKELRYMQVLCNRLVKNQMWKLALNVATKTGSNTHSIWSSWGMACLMAGDYRKARQNFSKVLKPGDKSLLLGEIVSYLESRPFDATFRFATDIGTDSSKSLAISSRLNRLQSIMNGVLENVDLTNDMSVEDGWIDPVFRRECEYYLEKYGSHRMMLQFWMRHNLIDDCLRYIDQYKVTHNIFHNEVLMECLQIDKLDQLVNKLKCYGYGTKYLVSSCKLLERHQYWESLLLLQKLMGDNIRASMCLIRMYVHEASSFTTLSFRKHYLSEAATILTEHMNSKHSAATNKTNAWTINTQINCIYYQIDVTKFLVQIEQSNGSLDNTLSTIRHTFQQLSANSKSTIPTVFNLTERMVLAVLCVCVSNTIEEGLSYSYRLVETTGMSAPDLLKLGTASLFSLGRDRHAIEFIKSISEWGLMHEAEIRNMIWPSLKFVNRKNQKTVESLLSMFPDHKEKIDVLFEIGHLRQAYVLTAQQNSKTGMQKLLKIAKKMRQEQVQSLCQRWLKNHT